MGSKQASDETKALQFPPPKFGQKREVIEASHSSFEGAPLTLNIELLNLELKILHIRFEGSPLKS